MALLAKYFELDFLEVHSKHGKKKKKQAHMYAVRNKTKRSAINFWISFKCEDKVEQRGS